MTQTDAIIASLIAIYAAIIVVLVQLIRGLGIATERAIIAGFVIFGLVTGILAEFLWPLDSSPFANFLAVWLGDWAYVRAIEWFGNPHSSQAHYTIPWALQVPQVYMVTSFLSSVLVGLAIGWIHLYSKKSKDHYVS